MKKFEINDPVIFNNKVWKIIGYNEKIKTYTLEKAFKKIEDQETIHAKEEQLAHNTLDYYHERIIEWAKQRNLLNADPNKQFIKLIEELGELASGLSKNKPDVVIDSIGDAFVVLTILSEQLGLSLTHAVNFSYDEIKNRTGKMVNGVFVKEADLK